MSYDDAAARAALVPLARALAPLVVAEIRALLSAPETYSTRGPLPPGRSARWLREHARGMGGTRTGGARGRGVVWYVTAAQYEAYVARGAPPSAESIPSKGPDVDDVIARAGYRASRR